MVAPREDRARLLDATHAHLSPVFAAYDDPERESEPLLATCSATPDRIAKTDDGTVHKVWRIANPETIADWPALLRDKCLYVLDGHHRYETMVAFHGRQREGSRRPDGRHGLMFLVSAAEPGLVILPTHRIVHGVGELDRDRFLAEVSRDCEVELRIGAARDATQLRAALDAASGRTVFAAVFPRSPDAHLLVVRDGRPRATFEHDASILHKFILGRALAESTGVNPTAMGLQYISNTTAALAQIAQGEGQLALIMRPPTLAQIKQVADAGKVMPQKSTYFFPKLASGLVVMPVE
jgi:uncharacterized protein (DUF1015 family)